MQPGPLRRLLQGSRLSRVPIGARCWRGRRPVRAPGQIFWRWLWTGRCRQLFGQARWCRRRCSVALREPLRWSIALHMTMHWCVGQRPVRSNIWTRQPAFGLAPSCSVTRSKLSGWPQCMRCYRSARKCWRRRRSAVSIWPCRNTWKRNWSRLSALRRMSIWPICTGC